MTRSSSLVAVASDHAADHERAVLHRRQDGGRHRRVPGHRADDRPRVRRGRGQGHRLVTQGRRLRPGGGGAVEAGGVRGHPRRSVERGRVPAAGSADQPARVINIGSIDGIKVPLLETYSYSASKAAVHMLTRHLAKQLAPAITVNAIAPGPFESKMMAATLDAFGEQIAAAAPLKRIGRPDDMVGATIYLASRAGAYLTGAVIPVDGGIAAVG